MTNTLQRKSLKAARLATKALKDKFKVKPAKGYKYLKELSPGDKFTTGTGMKGILIRCETNATVLITECNSVIEKERAYYMGKRTIGAETEVKLTEKLSGWKKEYE